MWTTTVQGRLWLHVPLKEEKAQKSHLEMFPVWRSGCSLIFWFWIGIRFFFYFLYRKHFKKEEVLHIMLLLQDFLPFVPPGLRYKHGGPRDRRPAVASVLMAHFEPTTTQQCVCDGNDTLE